MKHSILLTVGALCFASGIVAQTQLKKHEKTHDKKMEKKDKEAMVVEPFVPNSIRKVSWRMSEQQDVAKANQILDRQFIPIGDKEPNATIIEDDKNKYLNHTVYKFNCDGKTNRIEMSSAFGSEENLKAYSTEEIKYFTEIKDSYINSKHGDYGDVMEYSWYTKFPDAPAVDKGGIFAQWHGRPDRTKMVNTKGEIKKLSVTAMKKVLDTMYFDDRYGKNKVTNKPSGWRVDASAGGPIAEMSYHPPYMYMMVRSCAEHLANNDIKVRPLPEKVKVGEEIGKNGKTGFLAFSVPTNEVPVNKWIHFRSEIKFSKYSLTEDKVLDKGYIKVWMDDKLICDLKDVNIGKNDELGPYFKYGIYKPGEAGFSVEHCGFTEHKKNDKD